MVVNRFLTRHGFEVMEANKGKRAIELIKEKKPDLILCDYRLEDMDGSSMLKIIKEINPSIPVIIITGFSSIKTAVEVIRLGAVDYIIKPLIPDEILMTIRKALKNSNATTDERPVNEPNTRSGEEKRPVGIPVENNTEYIFGESQHFVNILKQIDLVAPTNYSVIIYGESGSGKEAIAQEIHKRSKRSHKPFVAIDCGVLSKELAGSELFGHEKGAFTGAVSQKTGSFEVANGGTIFLDEIANLTYDVQVSLLRVVQERKVRRVGGNKDIDLDVRIILASNEKLWDVSGGTGRIREDLFHRFNEFVINVPPLRERPDDIMVFANHFLAQSNAELSKSIKGFHLEVETIFRNYMWYGNIRELKNVVKRAALLCDGNYIDVKCIPFELANFNKLQFDLSGDQLVTRTGASPMTITNNFQTPMFKEVKERTLKSASIDAEYELILEALKKVNFNKSKAAKVLQIDRKTLYYKIKQYHELREERKGDGPAMNVRKAVEF